MPCTLKAALRLFLLINPKLRKVHSLYKIDILEEFAEDEPKTYKEISGSII